ncbi:DUF6266 family protein [Nostoc sp. NIES-2111]
MSIISQGILGGFSGKTGPVIGSSWRGKPVMRAKPVFKKNRTFTTPQLDQQEKFKLMRSFLGSIDYLLNLTYKRGKDSRSGFQEAFSENIKNAIAGELSPFSVDYAKVKLAHGSIPILSAISCVAETGNLVKFSWTLLLDQARKASEADKAVGVLYCPEQNLFLTSEFSTRRSGLELTMDAALFTGQEVHSWFFFLSDNEAQASESRYTGSLTVTA